MNFRLTRREFVISSTAILTLPSALAQPTGVHVQFGMVTDSHYADRPPNGSRYYRESKEKMQECVAFMNSKPLDFVIELGDFKDENSPAEERETLRFLESIEQEFKAYKGPRYYVLGNHDLDSISKKQFLARVENTGIEKGRSYYSFQKGGVHFIVLDACFTGDGSPYDHGNFEWTDANINNEQMTWLTKDLVQAGSPVIVFVHQLLCGEGNVYINNAKQVRAVLEESKKVAAVFHGHHHMGEYQQINGIHYYTLKAMVEGSGLENSSYAVVSVNDKEIVIEGYRKAVSQTLVV